MKEDFPRTKKVLKILLLIFLLFLIYINYHAHFSEAARIGKRNIENMRSVKPGMNVDEVLSIMGEPDLKGFCDRDSISVRYAYYTNDDSYFSVSVCFDSTMKVKTARVPKYFDN